MNSEKKQKLIDKILKYSDGKTINIADLRLKDIKTYSCIPYYFGNVDNMLSELKLTKVQNKGTRMTFRDQLALEYLIELRKQYTLDQIAKKFNVTKSLVNQQYQKLELADKETKVKLPD